MACDYAKALELAKAGHWDAAHNLVQPHTDRLACLIHGYLHRVEGDLSNAHYWYRRAGKGVPALSLDAEWQQLSELVQATEP